MKKILSLILAAMMCLTMVSTVFAAEFKFTDVKEEAWYYADVKNAVEMGLVNGKTATEYKPDDNLTYAEAIKLAACMNQLYNEGIVTLKNGDPWYQPYVDYCVDNGIIDKYYDYDEKATRSGYMVIFAHALPDEALKTVNNVPDNSIPDVPTSSAYSPEVYKLYRAGILQGSDDIHSCKPHENIKRSEVAAILSRMMDETKRVKFSTAKEDREETKALVIKTQPEDVTVKANEKATFTVEVEGGKEPYSYRWMLDDGADGVALEETGDTIIGVSTNELSITPDEASETLIFCLIADSEGTVLKTNVVKLIGEKDEQKPEEVKPLEITSQPEDATAKAGETVTLTVEVKGGKAPYTYQWQSKTGKNFMNLGNSEAVSGADSDTLSYMKAVAASKDFRCVITDADGQSVTSEAAKVTFTEEAKPLTIKTQPEGTTVKTGESATLSVTVEGGKAPYTYQWEYYARYGKSASWSKIASATENEVSVSQVGAGNVKYHCVITDAEGASVTSEECTVTWEDNGFLMYVEDVFYVANKGTVLTGKITYGEIKTNDTIYIVAADGTKTEAVVTAIEMFNKILDEAQAGDNVGLLVPSVEKTAVARGNALIKADSDYTITTTLVGTLTLLSKEEGGLSNKIESGYQAQFYYASHDETGTITFSAEGLEPGATLEDVKVVLKEKLPRFLGQTFDIKIAGRKIGTFTVTEVIYAPTRRPSTTRPSTTRPSTTPTTEE